MNGQRRVKTASSDTKISFHFLLPDGFATLCYVALQCAQAYVR